MKQHNLTDRPQDLTGDTQHLAGELWNHRRQCSRVVWSTRARVCVCPQKVRSMRTHGWMLLAPLTIIPLVESSGAEAGALARLAWFPSAPALPAPEGQILRAASVEELFQAATDVKTRGPKMRFQIA